MSAQTEYTVETVPNPKSSTSNDFVSNPDKIIYEHTEDQLNILADSLEKHNGVEVAIVLLHSIGKEDIKDFAVNLFEHWGIGKEGADNGLLILFVENQRSITFETGYGIEGDLPDAICKRIQMENMVPFFKDKYYDGGMVAGVESVITVLEKGKHEFVRDDNEKFEMYAFFCFTLIVWSVVFAIVAIRTYLKISKIDTKIILNRPNSYYRIGAAVFPLKIMIISPPLFFLYLFLLFYKRYVRTKPCACLKCSQMIKGSVNKEIKDQHLSEKNRFEEKLKSVEYDVWWCNMCDNVTKLSYRKNTEYNGCPKCGAIAFRLTILRKIEGLRFSGDFVRYCKYCHYEESLSKGDVTASVYPVYATCRSTSETSEEPELPKQESEKKSFLSRKDNSSNSAKSKSSSRGSWGGGRSGGGGATSSW